MRAGKQVAICLWRKARFVRAEAAMVNQILT
jgi:hypothetical protein